jgi:polysaccharide export outer membrane protein
MMRHQLERSVCVLLVLVAMLRESSAEAQNGAGGVSPNHQPSSTKIIAVPVPIAAGDLLEISVFDAPELAQQVRVGADGEAQLALIGSTLLAGLTGQEAAEMIARELRERNFLLRPQVNVLVREFASQGVSVTGEVQHPGVYQVLGPRSLLDVVSMAGGLTNVADNRITIKRRSRSEKNVTVKLNTDDAETSLANDVQVYPGDLVLVPRAGIVYVLGDVGRPGGFVMQNNGEITLLQALAQAGGATTTAAVNRGVLLRKNSTGYVTQTLHLGRIARGQEEDFEMHPNDIVFIPNSRLKNIVRDTQSIASTVGSASIYAIVH